MNAKQEYELRFEHRKRKVNHYQNRDRLVSWLRGISFLFSVLTWWLGSEKQLFSVLWALVPLFVFAVLMILHERILQKKSHFIAAAEFYSRGIDRLENHWAGKGESGQEFLDPNHPYAGDLDIFGKGSLFERICLARTHAGQIKLSNWLLEPANPEEIPERQEAVRELAPELDFREELSLAGHQYREAQNSRMLLKWAQTPAQSFGLAHRVVARALVLTTVGTAMLWGFRLSGSTPFIIALAIQATFGWYLKKRTSAALEEIDTATSQLQLLAKVLAVFEIRRFQSQFLTDLRKRLDSGGSPTSVRVARLAKLLELLDWRRNHFFTPIGGLLLWKTQIAFAVDAWKEKNCHLIPDWIDAVAQLEALHSFACFSFERPDLSFPKIESSQPCVEGVGIGHPLLPEAQCIRNDLILNSQKRLLIVSGSNMSGKSTLLRAVGLNVVLALSGAPVCAQRLTTSPLAIGASLVIRDSLLAGVSHFYAEILRLRQIMELTTGKLPVLFLLDEILHGTNSSDRLAGSQAYVRGLLNRGAIGLVTTHDLALAQIVEEFAPHAENIHFVDHLEGGKIVFDYRIYPGVVRKSNALELMRSVGLDV